MTDNPYEYTRELCRDVKSLPLSRGVRSLRMVHLALMICQLGFWIWIIGDQRSSWQQSGLLLAFFTSMIATFSCAVAADVLCICGFIGKAEVYICVISICVCILLAGLMLGAHSAVVIVSWLIFSVIWGFVAFTRLAAAPVQPFSSSK